MYALISVVLSLVFISVAVSHCFITEKKWALINKKGCIAAGAAGLVSSVSITVLFFIRSSSYTDGDREWARGVFTGYLKDVLLIVGIILAILILSSVFQPKMKVLRIILTAASSVFVLVFGYISSFISDNDSVSVKFFICALSISLSIMIQFCGFFDFGRLYEKLCSDSGKKNNKKHGNGR